MEYIYATLTLNELNQELNQENITAVLEAAGSDVIESRVKAIVAALEDVDLDELGTESGIAPAPAPEVDSESNDAAPNSDDSDARDDTTGDNNGNTDGLAANPGTENLSEVADAPLEEPEANPGDASHAVSSTAEPATAGGETTDERTESDGGASMDDSEAT